MRYGWRGALLALGLLLGGCSTLSKTERLQAADYAEQARSDVVGCSDNCAVDSPLLALGDTAYAASTAAAPRHATIILDAGQDSLLARVVGSPGTELEFAL